MNRYETIKSAILLMQEFWPDWKVTDNTFNAWCIVLEDYPLEQVQFGLMQFIKQPKKTYVKVPRPDQIVEIIHDHFNTSWDEVFDEICAKAYQSLHPVFNMGRWIEIKWSHPDVPVLMERMGGASYFAELNTKDLGVARAQFRQVYENYSAKHGSITDAKQTLLKANSRGLLNGQKESFV